MFPVRTARTNKQNPHRHDGRSERKERYFSLYSRKHGKVIKAQEDDESDEKGAESP